jgi:hypothetical protein
VERLVQIVLFCNFEVRFNRCVPYNWRVSKTGKSKGTFSPRTGREGPEGE